MDGQSRPKQPIPGYSELRFPSASPRKFLGKRDGKWNPETRETMETHFAFTDTKIAKLNKRDLPDGKGEQFFYDAKTPGLAVRLRSSGAKSYIYFLNRKQRITIGDAAKLKVEQARDAASIHAGDM